MVAMPEDGISVTSHKSQVTSHQTEAPKYEEPKSIISPAAVPHILWRSQRSFR